MIHKNIIRCGLALATLVSFSLPASAVKQYELTSPSEKLDVVIECDSVLSWQVNASGQEILSKSPMALTLADGQVWGLDPKVRKVRKRTVDETVATPFTRSAEMRDNYNGLTLDMKDGWSVEFRAYDDAVAYRFISSVKRPFEIKEEQVELNFPANFTARAPYVRTGTDDDMQSQFFNSFENYYTVKPVAELNPRRLAFLPLAVEAAPGLTAVFTETDLNDYPGLYLYNPSGDNSLRGKHAPYPTVVEAGGYNNIQGMVRQTAPYIAKVYAPRSFPWRVLAVGDDRDLASTNISYLLAEPSRIADTSWIKPGKVAWDWWNHWNITGVDFEAGINTATYKHYIDFAAKNGIEYVILDDGWAVGRGEDLMKINPDIDLPAIIAYGKEKGVGIILWAGYMALERDLENICRHYAGMGVKGFKVDFEDRDDQLMVAFNHRAAKVAADNHLVLDLHGTYKPAGLNRTWPNVLNFEGVNGLENLKWSSLDQFDIISYDVLIPFIRQVAGPMDYTQGAMINGGRDNFRPIVNNPMSQGTRCHQLALYMVLDSPLNMMCDSPTHYEREQECTDFIASVPTVWDETVVLSAKMGDHIVTARRKGSDWYVGGINGWEPRELEIDLSSLGIARGSEMVLFTDGVNAHRDGNDYRRAESAVDSTQPLKVRLAGGGGFAVRISPAKTGIVEL